MSEPGEPGWYPDESSGAEGRLRYWDGDGWTDAVVVPTVRTDSGWRTRLACAVRVPSRAVMLALAAASVAVSATLGDRDPGDTRGPTYVLMFLGGLSIFVILVGWRWFWFGSRVEAVYKARQAADRS